MKPTPEQTRELVDYFGGRPAAAAAVGVHEVTVGRWLLPELAARHRRRERTRYWSDPEASRAQRTAWYRNLSGVEYNRLLLRQRRTQALTARAKREQRRQDGPVSP